MQKAALLITAVLSGAGVCGHTRPFSREKRKNAFVYYTNLSNLLVWLFYTAAFALSFFPETAACRVIMSPLPRFCTAMCILVTLLIYHFLLSKSIKKAAPSSSDAPTTSLSTTYPPPPQLRNGFYLQINLGSPQRTLPYGCSCRSHTSYFPPFTADAEKPRFTKPTVPTLTPS